MAGVEMRSKHYAAAVLAHSVVLATTLGAGPVDVRLNVELIDAARGQRMERIRALLDQGADPNAAHGDGSTPLHWAAYRDNAELVNVLLAAGARVDTADDHGITALWLACANGASAETVERLVRAGADVNAAHVAGETALMSASRTGNLPAVRRLLDSGAQVNSAERVRGQTALMWAATQGHADIVAALIERGADVHVRSGVRRALVNTTGNADYGGVMEVDQGGFTPLLFAARAGHVEVAGRLLAAGSSPNEVAADATSALVIAAHSGHTATARFFLDAGANPNASGSGYTALHIAIRRGDRELVATLLEHGADPNARLVKPTPARRLSDDVALARPLVGATPIWLAAYFNQAEIVRALTGSGADFRSTANDGTSPLMAAIGRSQDAAIPVVAHLAALGADVNTADETGNTALHRAASNGFDAIVRVLVDHGARVEARNLQGQTPLMLTRRRSTAQGVVDHSATGDLLRALGARN